MAGTVTPFDPYLQWLGIRDPERPPNHYRLLGLEPFEEDQKAIASAADRQMAHVRTFQSGKYSEQSQEILNLLAAAKLCLLKPERKAQYDATLREAAKPAPVKKARPAAKRAPVARLAVAVTTDSTSPSAKTASAASRYAGRKKQRPSLVMWVAVGVGLLAAVVLIVAIANLRDAGEDDTVAASGTEKQGPSGRENGHQQPGGGADVDPGRPADQGDDKKADGKNGKTDGNSPSDPDDGTPDDANPSVPAPWAEPRQRSDLAARPRPDVRLSSAVVEPLKAARAAMSNRDLEEADSQLARAMAKARTDADKAEISRLQAVLSRLQEFWTAVGHGAKGLHPGQTRFFRGVEVSVVSVDGTEVVLKTQDGEQKAFSTDQRQMDPDLAVSLAEQEIEIRGPVSLVVVGAFEAMDHDGDICRARDLWQQAGAQTVPVDVLMPEVEYDYSQLASANPDGSPDAGPNGDGPPPSDEKKEVPPAVERTKASKLVEELYGKELTTPDRKKWLEVAEKLIRQGIESADSPAAQYCLLDAARRVAAAAGDGNLAFRAVEELERRFQVDQLDLKREVIRRLTKTVGSPDDAASLVELTFTVVDEAVGEDRYDVAESLLSDTHRGIIRSTKDTALMGRINERRSAVEFQRKQFGLAESEAETLQQDPDDPKANLMVGRYLCFVKNDWGRGAPHLVKSGDAQLAPLAREEVKRPTSATDQKNLAEKWRKLAEKQRSSSKWKRPYRLRAVYWYEQAIPGLKALDAELARKRCASLEKQEEEPSFPGPNVKGVVQPGNVALASNGTKVVGPTFRSGALIDGVVDSQSRNAASDAPAEWTVNLPRVYRLVHIRMLPSVSKDRAYQYAISVSADGKEFKMVADRRNGFWSGWQRIELSPPQPVKAIKISGLRRINLDTRKPMRTVPVVELEAYCIPPK